MATSTVNTSYYDPYQNFKFKVKWDNAYVAGVSNVGGLSRSTAVIEHRSGGDPSTMYKAPGLTEFDPIVLQRGVSQDVTFAQWANKVWYLQGGAGSEQSLADFRKNIIIELYNGAGQKVLSYNVYNCWVSQYVGLSVLDSGGSTLAFESLTLVNEGWIRDYSYVPPAPPQYTVPSS